MPTPSMNAARLDEHDRDLMGLQDRVAELEGKMTFLVPAVQQLALRVGRAEDAAVARDSRIADLEAAVARLQAAPTAPATGGNKKKTTARLPEPADLTPAGLATAPTSPSTAARGTHGQDASPTEDRVLPGPDRPDAEEGQAG